MEVLPLRPGLRPRWKRWGDRRDSNPQQPESQSGALPLNYDHHWKAGGPYAGIRQFEKGKIIDAEKPRKNQRRDEREMPGFAWPSGMPPRLRAWQNGGKRQSLSPNRQLHMFRSFALTFVLVILCQCGAPQVPHCRHVPMGSRQPATTLIAAARADWQLLANPDHHAQWPAATARYNQTVAKLFDQLRCGSNSWRDAATAMGARIAAADATQLDPATLSAVIPAAKVNCRVVKNHKITDGIGIPLVGWKRTAPVGAKRDPFVLPTGQPYTLTAVLEFDAAGTPVWRILLRARQETLRVGGATQPLAADWTAPNAFYWKMCELDDLKIQNVILPERFMEDNGIYFVGGYDPNKIPVVFVHGLVSSPDAFKNMINELAPEPWFRKNYQIWLYNYPTGNPWLFSSVKFRAYMHDACAYGRSKGGEKNLNRMVVVAHSMGGVLTHSSVVDPGTKIYDAHYTVPFDKLTTTAKNREFIRESMLYQPLREPKRVIFLATPHRGSPAANFSAATWISRIIRLPKTLTVEVLDTTLRTVNDIVQGDDPLKNLPTSIDSLSPSYKSNKALDRIALPKSITFHSIIGDRGKGNTPNSSDGVVPYWSSHITPVRSEIIVPSGHSVQDHPAAAAEVKRILQLHLAK